MAEGIGAMTARRHVADAERRIARLQFILASLMRRNRLAQIEVAESLLAELETSLRLTQDHPNREK